MSHQADHLALREAGLARYLVIDGRRIETRLDGCAVKEWAGDGARARLGLAAFFLLSDGRCFTGKDSNHETMAIPSIDVSSSFVLIPYEYESAQCAA